MEKISTIILPTIGLAVLLFSYWGFRLIQKHVKRFNIGYKFPHSLTDEKYFELKARQDYIIASSAIVFTVITFIGYSSIEGIKKEMNSQMTSEIKRLDSIRNSANETLINFSDIEIKGKTLQDSVRSAMNLVSVLKSRMAQIFEKDVINQNIYIVDPLKIGDFPHDTKQNNEDFRVIKFKDLLTVSGQKLPIFKNPPSIVCFSTNNATLYVTDVTVDGFKVNPAGFSYLVTESSPQVEAGDHIKFSVWISQKKGEREFSDDFSKDFK